MEKLLVELQEHSETVETLVEKIEAGEAYMEELKAYLPILNQMIIKLFELFQTSMYSIELSQEFVLQVLNDIIYGIEKEDTVCARVRVNLSAMRKWAVQYALHAKILTPPSLADCVKSDLVKALENYNTD